MPISLIGHAFVYIEAAVQAGFSLQPGKMRIPANQKTFRHR